jgi:hypothetical protein
VQVGLATPFLCDDGAHCCGNGESAPLRAAFYRNALDGTPILDW